MYIYYTYIYILFSTYIYIYTILLWPSNHLQKHRPSWTPSWLCSPQQSLALAWRRSCRTADMDLLTRQWPAKMAQMLGKLFEHIWTPQKLDWHMFFLPIWKLKSLQREANWGFMIRKTVASRMARLEREQCKMQPWREVRRPNTSNKWCWIFGEFEVILNRHFWVTLQRSFFKIGRWPDKP